MKWKTTEKESLCTDNFVCKTEDKVATQNRVQRVRDQIQEEELFNVLQLFLGRRTKKLNELSNPFFVAMFYVLHRPYFVCPFYENSPSLIFGVYAFNDIVITRNIFFLCCYLILLCMACADEVYSQRRHYFKKVYLMRIQPSTIYCRWD